MVCSWKKRAHSAFGLAPGSIPAPVVCVLSVRPVLYYQRLTNDVVGVLAGYLDLHGCNRLPEEIALIFLKTPEFGACVEIVN